LYSFVLFVRIISFVLILSFFLFCFFLSFVCLYYFFCFLSLSPYIYRPVHFGEKAQTGGGERDPSGSGRNAEHGRATEHITLKRKRERERERELEQYNTM
jgi:hypothetical protein